MKFAFKNSDNYSSFFSILGLDTLFLDFELYISPLSITGLEEMLLLPLLPSLLLKQYPCSSFLPKSLPINIDKN